MFRLSEKETDFMVSQNAIPSKQHLGSHLPYVFTEHGVLSNIYLILNQKVILDDDLTELYEVETRRLNEQVKRNIIM